MASDKMPEEQLRALVGGVFFQMYKQAVAAGEDESKDNWQFTVHVDILIHELANAIAAR